jgi:hypothetical protein
MKDGFKEIAKKTMSWGKVTNSTYNVMKGS